MPQPLLDSATHRLFISCTNRILVVVDTDSRSEIATVPIGRGTDAVGFDPKRKLIFNSNGLDATLSVIQEKDAKTFVALGDVKTAVSARTMAIDGFVRSTCLRPESAGFRIVG